MSSNRSYFFKKYAIYQLPFESVYARELSFMEASEIESISDHFELVGIIDGLNLNDVFMVSNCCGEDPALEARISRCGEMHSLSVGDIVHDLKTDETWVVGNFGFDLINMKECV